MTRFRLAPEDEHTHPVEPARNFNESMYINLFDHAQRQGGWFRVGNRPNEGHAEVSCCLYFADGRAGFLFQRPEIQGNAELAAGGMRFEVVEPFVHVRLTYNGAICLLANPQEMADPKRAFATNYMVPCRVALDFRGVSPMYGGEKVDSGGRPLEEPPEQAFARAHYEQHMKGEGTVTVGGRVHTLAGLGLRDHSWGPRYWQNIYWYRWLPMSFSEDFAAVVSIIATRSGPEKISGVVLRRDARGQKDYVPVEHATLESDYDTHEQAVAQRLSIRTAEREYTISGRSLSLLPLRNRRKTEDGRELHTRITEAMTEFVCDGQVGYGMSEYLDQIVDGRPVGRHC